MQLQPWFKTMLGTEQRPHPVLEIEIVEQAQFGEKNKWAFGEEELGNQSNNFICFAEQIDRVFARHKWGYNAIWVIGQVICEHSLTTWMQ